MPLRLKQRCTSATRLHPSPRPPQSLPSTPQQQSTARHHAIHAHTDTQGVCTHTHVCTQTCKACAHTHTCAHRHAQACAHTRVHTDTHRRVRTHAGADTPRRVHTQTHTPRLQCEQRNIPQRTQLPLQLYCSSEFPAIEPR